MPEPISESLGVLYVIVNTLCALAMCNCDSVPEPISLTVGMLYVCVCELNTVIYTLCIGSWLTMIASTCFCFCLHFHTLHWPQLAITGYWVTVCAFALASSTLVNVWEPGACKPHISTDRSLSLAFIDCWSGAVKVGQVGELKVSRQDAWVAKCPAHPGERGWRGTLSW